jgi:4-amino-4-deoxy-L-arabinose transferase-like glycosyltransferase
LHALQPGRSRIPPHTVLLALILLIAALLRLDAFVGKYGTFEQPAWARVVTQRIGPLAASLRPADVQWARERTPYVGGDPINYLKYAREMTSFYQAHLREPVFLALTRASLWALDNHDAGVSLASALGSTLAVLAAYLLGAALLGPAAGLSGAALLAIEYEVITWAPDGWRDDTFMATVLFATWSLVRLHRAPAVGSAVLAGVLCGIATLTRITALTFVLPALLWLVVSASRPRLAAHARAASLALLLTGIVVAPYMISLAWATGDPLHALNYHTVYYRHAEGMPIDRSMTAAEYLRTKFASYPVRTLDTAFEGLFVQPFVTKWRGFDPWLPGFGAALAWLAIAGLALMLFDPAGRLVLVILLTSLVPYAFTWNLGDPAWRFTMHAYPLYLIASVYAVVAGVRAARMARRSDVRPLVRPVARRVAFVALIAVGGAMLHIWLPWFVIREAIAAGEPTSVPTGRRDWVFYPEGWSPPHDDGVTVRVSVGERSVIGLPLPSRRDYDLVLRVDPVAPDARQQLRVYFNRQPAGLLQLAWDPERMGSYRIRLPADATRARGNELLLVPEPTITAGDAGPRFAWMPPDERIGVRLWYVRVTPE